MTAELFNTTDWPFEKLAPYGKDITAGLKQLEKRFPRDCNVESLAKDVLSGRFKLWLVLEEGKFVLFGLTETKMNFATGNKVVSVDYLAGQSGVSSVPLMDGVEEWAKSIGANEVTICGRFGWKKPLAKQGYKARTVLYRKDI